ncbi:hypothetical protein N7G274_008282 [Stereocaulon virgatum]|uniref:DOC domain-containing protein n=1 Tax=Stereocaulon virgatum TaxID=373712 RepID=A0ABR4A3H8_9LECA
MIKRTQSLGFLTIKAPRVKRTIGMASVAAISPTHAASHDPNTLQEMVDDADVDELTEEDPITLDPTQDPHLPPHLREISSLASWQVSTSKPNCGIDALLSHSPSQFWQSDGPQPHLLTIHFCKLVKIVKMRVYLDFSLDESYTPTRMSFWGGTGHHDLLPFAEWRGEEPRGWVDVDLDGVGVGGKAELRAFIVQVRVLENHQNGKDTHVRGVQIFAKDEREVPWQGMGWEAEIGGWGGRGGGKRASGEGDDVDEDHGVEEPPEWPEWMGEPEIR